MKERPILMSAPMVRALLDGTKTQTRRAVKPQPQTVDGMNCTRLRLLDKRGEVFIDEALEAPTPHLRNMLCPYGRLPGDRLWVREAWKAHTTFDHLPPRDIPQSHVWYMADDGYKAESRYRQGMFMPRWASRITLEVMEVRVERLQDISDSDAIAEGIKRDFVEGDSATLWRNYATGGTTICPVFSYQTLWESINGVGSWNANPWVWAISFRRLP
jgi:hypothetical protein